MTALTRIDHLRGSHLREIADRREAHRGHVIAARPVATFAAGFVGRFLAGSDRLEVGIAIEVIVEFRVTKSALLAPDEFVSCGLGCRLSYLRPDTYRRPCQHGGKEPNRAHRESLPPCGVGVHDTPA